MNTENCNNYNQTASIEAPTETDALVNKDLQAESVMMCLTENIQHTCQILVIEAQKNDELLAFCSHGQVLCIKATEILQYL